MLRQLRYVITLLGLDAAFLALLVVRSTGYWYGSLLLRVSIGVIVGLCLVEWRLPRDLFPRRAGPPTASRLQFFRVGCFGYPMIVMATLIGAGARLPPLLVRVGMLCTRVGFLAWVLHQV
ncbi:MAG: hypothetical protein L3K17_09750 [Thermoplasmata archaeon]|nr:hypothetical protein [Thermoplasmata archaeon]